MSNFQADDRYVLAIDGERATARIHLSQRAAALLVQSPELAEPLLVWAGSKRVDRIPEAAVLERPDGGFDLPIDVSRTLVGPFRNDKLDLVLPLPDRDVRLRLAPALTGLHRLEDLLAHTPSYATALETFVPQPSAVDELADLAGPIRIRVFFGTWCSHCKEYLPHALRLDRALSNTGVRFEYYGLDYPPEGWKDAEVEKHRVENLPTAIVYREEQEVGRLIGGADFQSPERSLVDLLSAGRR